MNFWEYNNMQIIDGKKIRNEILEQLKEKVETLPFQPIFCDIVVGDDPVSHSYVKIKEKTANETSIIPITTNKCFLDIPDTKVIPNQIKKIIIAEPKSGCKKTNMKGMNA